MDGGRWILHMDMDAFFASVEQLDRPEFRGRPLLVGHDGPRGVVAAASYEARKFGCRSAQPMAVAKRLCPEAVIMPGRHERYAEISERVFDILESHSPLLEPLSIDEAFLDLTGTERLLGSPEQIGQSIRRRIKDEIGLTASVGIAPNKYMAKLASDLCKPDGLLLVRPKDIDRILPPLPVSRIWGVGPKTAARLEAMGVRTIGDLRKMPDDFFGRHFGNDADHYRRLALGQDDRPVISDHEARSISQEETFGVDVADPDEVRNVLLGQVEQVGRRLRRHKLHARCVVLKIRYGNFQTITRSATLEHATDSTAMLWQAAKAIFDQWAMKFQPVRLIGMGAKDMGGSEPQLHLFADPSAEKQKQLDKALDRINDRFGRRIIGRGKR